MAERCGALDDDLAVDLGDDLAVDFAFWPCGRCAEASAGLGAAGWADGGGANEESA